MLTTTKSLIFLSFLLAFAVALQDGDQIAFKAQGTPFNPRYQYMTVRTDGTLGLIRNIDYSQASGTWFKAHLLEDGSWAFESLSNITVNGNIWLNGNTHTGSVNLQGNTTDPNNSGTHWAIETLSDGNVALKTLATFKNHKFTNLHAVTAQGYVNLANSTVSGVEWEIVGIIPTNSSNTSSTTGTSNQQVPAQNTQLADFIKAHADEIASEPTIDVNYCLSQFTSTTFQDQFGDIIGAIIDAGCAEGLQLCDLNDLYGLINQLVDNGVDLVTIQQIYILIGSMIGSLTGEEACEGFPECSFLGGKIGTCMACLSVSKEVFDGIVQAVATLQGYVIEAGDVGQDALNAMNYAANTLANGVQNAIDQLTKGASDDAMTALQDVSDQVGQGFNNLNDAIQNLLDDIGRTVANGVNEAGQVIVDTANEAGTWITETAIEAGQEIARVADQIASGFCGVFGC